MKTWLQKRIAYLEWMVWWGSGKAKDVAVHSSNNKIKIVSTIHIVSQNHGVPVSQSAKKWAHFIDVSTVPSYQNLAEQRINCIRGLSNVNNICTATWALDQIQITIEGRSSKG